MTEGTGSFSGPVIRQVASPHFVRAQKWARNILTFARPLWANPLTRRSVGAGVAVFVIFQLMMIGWVHFAFEGRYHGPFLASEKFGISKAEVERGYFPVVPRSQPHNGWDGQFYFRASLDPFGRTDAMEHMELIAYRYQRIGIPLMAWATSKVCGYRITSAFIYHSVQILLVALGFAFLVRFLLEQGISPWFALTWLGAGGTWYTLAYGLPDASADGVFILSLYSLWNRHLRMYAISTALLVLIREGYVVYAFPTFLLTALGLIRWNDSSRYLTRFLVTALPGAVLIAWTGYLYVHLGSALFSATRPNEGFFDWPFRACWFWLREQWGWPNAAEIRYKIFTAVSMLLIFGLLLRRIRASVALVCVLPYVVLMLCLGTVVWWDQSGYFKAMGSLLVLGIFLLSVERGLLLKFVLTLHLVLGLEWNAIRSIIPAPFYSPNGPVVLHFGVYPNHPFNEGMSDLRYSIPPLPNHPENERINDFAWELRWVDPTVEVFAKYQGPWRRIHRELTPLRIAVTNRSSTVWQPNPQVGFKAVNLFYLLTDGKGEKVILDGRVPLDSPVQPGETREVTLWLRIGKPQWHQLRLAMIQEGFHGVDLRQPNQGVVYPIRVR